MLREPGREDHTTWTAVAPDPVFTVLTYGTSQLFAPSLVHKSASAKSETSSSALRCLCEPAIMSQVRADFCCSVGEVLGEPDGA
jgi:hypothetical protein